MAWCSAPMGRSTRPLPRNAARKLKLLRNALAGIALLAIPCFAIAQTWPVKPIRNVLTLAGTDFLARSVATKLSEALGQPVVVDLVVGASGSIGAATVARAAPDGYTFMLTSSAQIVTRPLLSRNTPYDSVKSF